MTTATATEETTVQPAEEVVEEAAPVAAPVASGVSVKISGSMSFEQMLFLFEHMGLDGIKAMGLEPAWNEANSKKALADDAAHAKSIIEGAAKADLDEYMALVAKINAKKDALAKLCAENGVAITFISDGYSLRTKKEAPASATPNANGNGNGAAPKATKVSPTGVPSIREAALAGIEAAGSVGMSYAECQKHVQAVRGQDNVPSFNIHAALESDVNAGRVEKRDNGRWYGR